MRRAVLLALLALALPTVALATGIDYSSATPPGTVTCTGSCSSPSSGSFTLDFSGLSINGAAQGSGSIVFNINVGAALGGGVFDIGAGSTVTVNGSSGELFSGTFSSGTITELGPGEFGIAGHVSGITTAGFFSTGSCPSAGEGALCGTGSADVNVVPEPGTLGLLGTGLVGLAGVVRRKIRG